MPWMAVAKAAITSLLCDYPVRGANNTPPVWVQPSLLLELQLNPVNDTPERSQLAVPVV